MSQPVPPYDNSNNPHPPPPAYTPPQKRKRQRGPGLPVLPRDAGPAPQVNTDGTWAKFITAVCATVIGVLLTSLYSYYASGRDDNIRLQAHRLEVASNFAEHIDDWTTVQGNLWKKAFQLRELNAKGPNAVDELGRNAEMLHAEYLQIQNMLIDAIKPETEVAAAQVSFIDPTIQQDLAVIQVHCSMLEKQQPFDRFGKLIKYPTQDKKNGEPVNLKSEHLDPMMQYITDAALLVGTKMLNAATGNNYDPKDNPGATTDEETGPRS